MDLHEFEAKVNKKPKPKGKYEVQAGENKFKFFDGRKKNLAQYETIYKQGGMVTEAIDTYPLYILTNGYRFEGEDESLVQKVQDKCEEIDLDACIYQGVVDALVFGDGYQEIAPSATEDVGAVYPRPAKTFETLFDDFGVITGYRQTIASALGTNKFTIDFAPEDIIHIALHKVGGSPTGTSLIERSLDDIMRDAKIAESSAAAVERHGFPKYHIRVGQDGEDIPKEDMLSIANQFQDLKQMNEFVTVKDVEISSIDTQTLNISEYGNWAIQRLCSAIGVPEEMLGLGRGSTEATANVRLQAFYDKIGTYQKRIARIYNSQLIDKITGQPGAVTLVFNDVSPVDDELKARAIAQVVSMTPGDPFAIYPREWLKKQFEIDPEEYPDEEEEEIPMGDEFGEEMPDQGAPSAEDAFTMPSPEGKQLGANSAACKAVISRGDKPGPACGGAEEPSKKKPKKKGEPEGKKKPGGTELPASTSGSPTSQKQPGVTSFQRGDNKLSAQGKKDMDFIHDNRASIGRPTHNYALGKAGEQVMGELFSQLKAHSRWSDTQDLSNEMLYDVKCLNPKSEGTPVMPNQVFKKQKMAKETGKKWAFPVLVTSEDRIEVYLHTPDDKFYSLDPSAGDYYSIPIDKKDYLGFLDADGTFHKEAKR